MKLVLGEGLKVMGTLEIDADSNLRMAGHKDWLQSVVERMQRPGQDAESLMRELPQRLKSDRIWARRVAISGEE